MCVQVSPDHDLAPLEFALAVSLHHDAITGTQRRNVTEDYEQWISVALFKAVPKFLEGLQLMLYPHTRLQKALPPSTSGSDGISSSRRRVSRLSNSGTFGRRLAKHQAAITPAQHQAEVQAHYETTRTLAEHRPVGETVSNDIAPKLSMCLSLNVSLCNSSVLLSSGSGFLLVVYNPLSWQYSWGLRVPVSNGSYSVTGPDRKVVPSQLLPLSGVTDFAWPDSDLAGQEPHKPAADLAVIVSAPPLGHAVYKVERMSGRGTDGGDAADSVGGRAAAAAAVSEVSAVQADLALSSGKLEVVVGAAGIQSVASGAGNKANYTSSLIQYLGDLEGSGAYIFTASTGTHRTSQPNVTIVKGPVVQEVRQKWDGLGALTSRLWAGTSHLEVVWTVGPPFIDGARTLSREVFVRYNSSVRSSGLWFTDANGREYQQRRRDYRPAFSFSGNGSVGANLYPTTTGCYLKDAHVSLNIAVDRPQVSDGLLKYAIVASRFQLAGQSLQQLKHPADAGQLCIILCAALQGNPVMLHTI